MPASLPRRSKPARLLRDYLRIYESSEGLRLGISTRQILDLRKRNIIAVLNDAISIIYQQESNDGQTLLVLRDPEDFAFIGAQFDSPQAVH